MNWEWLGSVRNSCFESKSPCVLY